jgi:type VI protein secretion system component Hcp
MRPITSFARHALAAAVLTAFAATSAAAADFYLKLGDIKGESAAKSAQDKKIEVESWSFGATQPVAAATNLNSSKSNREIAVSDPGASGPKTTSKRQHGWVTVSKPLDRGSVRIKVKLPWLDCKVGAAFPDAVLQTAYIRYKLKEVMVSSCTVSGSGGGGGVPTESATLNYDSYRESPTRASQK